MKIWLKIKQNLLCAASEEFLVNFNSNSIGNQLESVLWCLRGVSFKFHSECPRTWIRIQSGLPSIFKLLACVSGWADELGLTVALGYTNTLDWDSETTHSEAFFSFLSFSLYLFPALLCFVVSLCLSLSLSHSLSPFFFCEGERGGAELSSLVFLRIYCRRRIGIRRQVQLNWNQCGYALDCLRALAFNID